MLSYSVGRGGSMKKQIKFRKEMEAADLYI